VLDKSFMSIRMIFNLTKFWKENYLSLW